MPPHFSDAISDANPVHVIELGGLEAFQACQSARTEEIVATQCLTSDLYYTTAFDMCPANLRVAASDERVPMTRTVSRSAEQAPRFIHSRSINARRDLTGVRKGIFVMPGTLPEGLKL